MKNIYLAALFAMAFSGIVHGQEQAYVLSNVTLIDGHGAPAQANMSVVVENGLIRDVYKNGDKQPAKDIKVIDLQGKYLIPGLIDSHVHVEGAPVSTMTYTLQGGVTSVRDVVGDPEIIKGMLKDMGKNGQPHTDIYYSTMFFGEEFLGERDMGGDGEGQPEYMKAWKEGVDIAEFVEYTRQAGATGIKVYAFLTPEVVSEITIEAHKRGIQIWIHGSTQYANASDIVDANVDVISHTGLMLTKASGETNPDLESDINFSDEEMDEILLRMKERDIIVDATLLVVERMAKHGGVPPEDAGQLEGLPAEERAEMQERADRDFKNTYVLTQRANELGLKISAGTDEPMPENEGELPPLHEELELLVKYSGLTPSQAITAATKISAETLGMEKHLGVIEAGKIADMVVLNKNPLVNISNTRDIDFVIKDGMRVE